MSEPASPDPYEHLRYSLDTTARAYSGRNAFYAYPARFHPQIARDLISEYSRPENRVLDPFMGGGTSVVEAISLGRYAIGSDINALAQFVTDVRTRPLSSMDKAELHRWTGMVEDESLKDELTLGPRTNVINLPASAGAFFSSAIELSRFLPPRRSRFARAALLRLGQLTLDSRVSDLPTPCEMATKLRVVLDQLISTIDQLVLDCRESGVAKNSITSRRLLLRRTAVGLDADPRLHQSLGKIRLVVTSPPYPGVHVLYHRWQYRGRRETPAPYWIAGVPDGLGASHYCGGSRTPTGLRNYFEMIHRVFRAIRHMMHPDGLVAQVVGFADPPCHLPMYLDSMERAGFRDVGIDGSGERIERVVANRKWYTNLVERPTSFTEILLLHRVRQHH